MLAAVHGIISQLHVLCISKCISWVLQIPVFWQLSSWGSDPCDWTLCPYPWFDAHALYPYSWDAVSSVMWYWLPNVGRSCDSHWDLIACIIRYLNSDLTLPLNQYHGPLWYFIRWGLQSHLIPVRPNQLILWTSQPLFVPMVLWTSLQGYLPLGCDRSWLFGLWLVPVCNGIEYPYAWSSSVVQDSLLKILLPDYQHILWLDVWVIYQFPVKNSWAMLPILLFQLVPCTLLLPLIMWLFFVIWNTSLSHCWLG